MILTHRLEELLVLLCPFSDGKLSNLESRLARLRHQPTERVRHLALLAHLHSHAFTAVQVRIIFHD